MKRILLFIALIITIPSFAQIEEEIMKSSKSAKIAQGRKYLVEKFLDRDYDKVKEIKDYLLSLEDDDYVALTPVELWHILVWTREFDALTANLRQMDSAYYHSFDNKIFPERDLLLRKLYLKGCEDEHLIRFNLQEAQLQPKDEAAVSLTLDWLLQKSDDEQNELNEKSTRFLKDYPNSDYEWFVRHFIRYQIEVSDFGWGFFIGLGGGIYMKDIGNWMEGTIGGSIGAEMNYKHFCFDLFMDGTDFRIKPYAGYQPNEKSTGSLSNINLSAGYDVLGKWRRCDLIPYAAIGCGGFSSKEMSSIPGLSDIEDFGVNYEFGVNFDYRFDFEKNNNGFLPGFIRLRYWYDLPHGGRYKSGLSGSCHCFAVCFGATFRSQKRVY